MALDEQIGKAIERPISIIDSRPDLEQPATFDDPRFVTKPSLPPLDDFLPYLEEIWSTARLTNGGPFHRKFEQALADYLGVKYVSLFANGTLALITAMQALGISGEVITTPFSFVATAHSLNWNQLTPIFVDVNDSTYNLDPDNIEAAITAKTRAIVPVHVYGQPCDVEAIEEIARRHNLFVVYDAAHAFGVSRNGSSILNAGDLSVLSFHATKVFNTFEGGAIISNNAEMKEKIDLLKNFGFRNEVTIMGTGINAKLNEIQSAFGLLQLKHLRSNITLRKRIAKNYEQSLVGLPGVSFLLEQTDTEYNYSYFPIFLDAEDCPVSRDALYDALKANNIFARRYFYPLITEFPPYNQPSLIAEGGLPVAAKASQEVLCLPIYPELKPEEQCIILDVIYKTFKTHIG